MNDARIKKAEALLDRLMKEPFTFDNGIVTMNGSKAVDIILEALPEMPTSEDIYLGVSMARVEYNKALDISELDDFHFGFMAGVKWLAKRLGIEE